MALPQLVDPMECLAQQRVFEGVVESEQLPRLAVQLCGSSPITYQLSFNQDESGRCIVRCVLNTCLKVLCQRCAQRMDFPLALESSLCVIVDDRLADDLPERYEPLVAVEGMISLADVVEEELLLAIPMIPRHDMMQCPVNLSNDLLN